MSDTTGHDTTATRRDDATDWPSVAEAAARLGISPGAVRKRAERGHLESRRGPGGRLLVRLPPTGDATARRDTTRHDARRDTTEAGPTPSALVEALSAEVGYLRSELTRANERLDDERRQRDDERRRHDTIVAQLTGRPPELITGTASPPGEKSIMEKSTDPAPNETTVELRLPAQPPATQPGAGVPRRPWWRRWLGQ